MKKILTVLFAFIVSLCAFTSCGYKDFKRSKKPAIDMYTNSGSVEFDDATFSLSNYSCVSYNDGETFWLRYEFKIKNKSYSTVNYDINDVVLTKDTTNATYTAYLIGGYNIEAEMTDTLSGSAEIPNDIAVFNYTLSFYINNQKITVHFYEMPKNVN